MAFCGICGIISCDRFFRFSEKKDNVIIIVSFAPAIVIIALVLVNEYAKDQKLLALARESQTIVYEKCTPVSITAIKSATPFI